MYGDNLANLLYVHSVCTLRTERSDSKPLNELPMCRGNSNYQLLSILNFTGRQAHYWPTKSQISRLFILLLIYQDLES